jgi:hypothetical protein
VCGIGERLRLAYALSARPLALHALAPSAAYLLSTFDPVTGERSPEHTVQSDASGSLVCGAPAAQHDWVALLVRPGLLAPPPAH